MADIDKALPNVEQTITIPPEEEIIAQKETGITQVNEDDVRVEQQEDGGVKININPPELGPIEVRISLKNDQANVNFYAQHGEVRDAIEEAFPRLRDMLSQNGLNLEDSNVSQHSFSQQEQQYNEDVNKDTAEYMQEDGSGLSKDAGSTDVVLMDKNAVDHYV